MKTLFLDLASGISGDMLLAALLDCGVDKEILIKELEKIDIHGWELNVKKVFRNQIKTNKVDVIIHDEHDNHDENHDHCGCNDHHHDHPHRDFKTISTLIKDSGLSDRAKSYAAAIFTVLAEAESTVHGIDIENVHFHEVGAVDSIIDIAGISIALDLLDIQEIYTTHASLGSGFTKSMHGIIPIPAPATVQLLKGYPVIHTEIDTEITTPTGAAVIKALSKGLLPKFPYIWEKIGCGAGSKKIEKMPNILRVFIGHKGTAYNSDEISVVESNIDDLNPEILAYTFEKILEAGAKDAFITPIIMKKGRAGSLLTVLVDKEKEKKIIDIIFRETTTLGIRSYTAHRQKLNRNSETVKTPWGRMKVKSALLNNKKSYFPEYEDCKNIALNNNIPLKIIYDWVSGTLNNSCGEVNEPD